MLTEAEIKKKLYGDFDTESIDTQSSSHEVKIPGASFEFQPSVQRDFSAHSKLRSPSFSTTQKLDSGAAQKAGSFSQGSDRKAVNHAKEINFQPKRSDPASDFNKQAIKLLQAFLGVVAGVLWKLGSYLVQALDFILRLLDPRKPQARKLLYSITACILVAALFFGVFRLNAQRKKAMLGELKSSDSVAVATLKPVSSVATGGILTPLKGSIETAQLPTRIKKMDIQQTPSRILSPSRGTEAISGASVETAPLISDGKYVIQVATYAVLEDANRVIQNIKQAGFNAFLKKQVRNSTGHAFYPVFLGRFESSALAQQALNRFRKSSVARPYQDSFIRTLE